MPDWPGTYGHNMFAYPASTWLAGPFDLLVEHSHRLLGTVAGLLSICLVISAYFWEKRVWFKWWTVFVLLSVIAQGALGGMRVLMDARTMALIHGCTGPLFFAIATATAVMSSRWWRAWGDEAGNSEQSTSSFVAFTVGFLLVVSFLQLIFGAQLRHATGSMPYKMFTGFVHMHLTLAALVLLTSAVFAVFAGISRRTPRQVRRVAWALILLIFVQISLGIATWIVNYALPWPELNETLASYTMQAKGFGESLIVTGHMATGSLIISFATVGTLRAWRSRRSRAK